MNELCHVTGVKQKLSTPYHPQTDGNTEILNQYRDQRLRPFVNQFQDDWSKLLPAMDFAQASLPHKSTGMSPYELELGHAPRQHWDWEERTRQPVPQERVARKTRSTLHSERTRPLPGRKLTYTLQSSATVSRRTRSAESRIGRSATGYTSCKKRLTWEASGVLAGLAGSWTTKPSDASGWSVREDMHMRWTCPNTIQSSRVLNPERLCKATAPLPGQNGPTAAAN